MKQHKNPTKHKNQNNPKNQQQPPTNNPSQTRKTIKDPTRLINAFPTSCLLLLVFQKKFSLKT